MTSTEADPSHAAITALVEDHLRGRFASVRDVVLRPRQVVRNGYSNITDIFDAVWSDDAGDRSQAFVVRRQPEGRQLFYESPVLFQWQMMEAIGWHSDVPVPSLVAAHPGDPTGEGAFFIMEAVDGRVPVNGSPSYHGAGWVAELSRDERVLLATNAVRALVQIHAVRWEDGFSFLRRTDRGDAGLEQFLAYQEEWYAWAAKGRSVPVLERGLRWLREHQPRHAAACVTWGDARVGNIIFGDDLEVAAVIDWEQAALGAPEMDVAWWLMFEELFTTEEGVPRLPGIPGRSELIDLYEREGGRPLDDIAYYDVLAWVRIAITIIRMACPESDDGLEPLEEPFLRRLAALLDSAR